MHRACWEAGANSECQQQAGAHAPGMDRAGAGWRGEPLRALDVAIVQGRVRWMLQPLMDPGAPPVQVRAAETGRSVEVRWRDGPRVSRVQELLAGCEELVLEDGTCRVMPPLTFRRELSLTGAVAAVLAGRDPIEVLLGAEGFRRVEEYEVSEQLQRAGAVLEVALGCYESHHRFATISREREREHLRARSEMRAHSPQLRAWLADEGISLGRDALAELSG